MSQLVGKSEVKNEILNSEMISPQNIYWLQKGKNLLYTFSNLANTVLTM